MPLIVLLSACPAECSEENPVDPENQPIGPLNPCSNNTPAITVNLVPDSLFERATLQATATANYPAGGCSATRTWSSTNTAAATIDANGLITGVVSGSTSITATENGGTGSKQLRVVPRPVASARILPSPLSVVVGQQVVLAAEFFTNDNVLVPGLNPTWSSSNASVATVSTNGVTMGRAVATGVVAGTSTIFAQVGPIAGSATLTVTNPLPGVEDIQVLVNCTSTGPVCAPPFSHTFTATSQASVLFQASPTHCGVITLQIKLDNVVKHTSGNLAAGASTAVVNLGPFSASGSHTLELIATGVPGGCIPASGQLNAWAGTLSLTRN
jgi:trimeric autotransporter adhesin